MAGEYRKLQLRRPHDVIGVERTPSSWWKAFRSPVLVNEHAAVTAVHFMASSPFDFAVTSGVKVQIYTSVTVGLKKTISRFTDLAFSGNIRGDGKLLVAGDQTGLVQLFDLGSRAILRSYKEHQGPVRVTKFLSQNRIVSAGDDRRVRVYDISAESSQLSFEEHSDYVRAISVCESNPALIVTGSYDHTAKLFDSRAGTSAVLTMRHGHPVEAALIFPDCTFAATSGSNEVKVWDIVGGGRLLRTLVNHQKTVTCLALDGSRQNFLAGGLDGLVKVYNVAGDYSVEHSFKYSAPVLSVAVSPDDTRLVVGTSAGILSVRRREIKGKVVGSAPRRRTTENESVFVFESKRKRRLAPYDKLLKTFQYSKALDAVLTTHQPAIVVASVLEELVRRDGLQTALAGRDEVALEPVVRFLLKHIANPRYSSLLIDVANLVLDLYGSVVSQSLLIVGLLNKMRVKIAAEIDLQERLLLTLGKLEMLAAATEGF